MSHLYEIHNLFSKLYSLFNKMRNKINITVNGVNVTGNIIERRTFSISVEITSPFSGLVKNASMEKFSTYFRDFMGDYGDETARKLLGELYDECLVIDQNVESIKHRIAGLLAEYNKIKTEMEPTYEKQRGYKQKFIHGELTEKEYKKELALLREIRAPNMRKIKELHIPPAFVLSYIKRNYGELIV
jgi:hypothetical protein